jgi:acetolactate synthase small subunit
MNIVLRGQDGVVEQARRQLEDLVPVWVVLDYTDSMIVERELLLAKVSILGPEHFHELIAHHKGDLDEEKSEHENPEVWNKSLSSPFLSGATNVTCRLLGFKMDLFTRGL